MTHSHLIRSGMTLIGAVAITGCAASSDQYPSLAIRDVERVSGSLTPAAPDPEPVAPVTDTVSLSALVAQARAAHQRFEAAVPGARELAVAARGLNASNNRWAQAQVALAELTSLRSDTAIALADLDLLEADAGIIFAPGNDIAAAQSIVLALVERQDATLASIQSDLSQ